METLYRKLPDGTFEVAGTHYDAHSLLQSNHGVVIVKDVNKASYQFFAPDMSPAGAFLKALILAFETELCQELQDANKWSVKSNDNQELTPAEKKVINQFNKVFPKPHPHLVGAALHEIVTKALAKFSKKYIKEKNMETFI